MGEVCSARIKRSEGRYVLMSVLLGLSCIVESLWEKFAQPEYRGMRAAMFLMSVLHGCPVLSCPCGRSLLSQSKEE